MKTLSYPRFYVLLLCIMILTACGYQLRGVADLSFHDIYIQGATLTISKDLKKRLAVNDINIVSSPEKAELMLELISESSEKRILSLSGKGVVSEYQLFYRVLFRLRDRSSETWESVQTIVEERDYSFDNSQVLAKESEEARLNNDMHEDAVREILRRLRVHKVGTPRAAEQPDN